MESEVRKSKYHAKQRIWFFTFPVSFFDSGNTGNVYMELTHEVNPDKCHILKVPFSFFRENRFKFDVRKKGDFFDLHLSAKPNNWLMCERSKGSGVSFQEFVMEEN